MGVSREGDSVGWLGEEQKERSYAIARAFSASRRCTWIVRLWINAIVSSVEWIRSFSSPSPFLFPLPFSLSFENENWLESRFSRWLIKVGKLCGIMYVSLYWIFTPRDENADVRFSANTWHDRKEKRSIVENVAYVTFFNLTWREGCCVWTRLKVIVYEIVQGSPLSILSKLRTSARLREISCMRIPRILRWNLREFRNWMSNNMIARRENWFWEPLA